jgi:hypothetical protein
MTDALRRLRRRPRLTRTVLTVTAGMVLVSGAPQWRDSGSTHAEAAAALIDLKSAAERALNSRTLTSNVRISAG